MYTSVTVYIIFALSFFVGAHVGSETPCMYEKISEEFSPEVISLSGLNITVDATTDNSTEVHHEAGNRRLLASKSKIRIVPDFSSLNGVDKKTKNLIQSKLIPYVISYFESFLKVVRMSENIVVPASVCYKAPVPHAHQTKGVANADLLIYVTAIDDAGSSGAVAWASACFLSQDYGNRPMVGQVNLIPSAVMAMANDWDRLVNLVIHEMTHVLGFSSSLFNYFIDDRGRPLKSVTKNVMSRGVQTTIITTPKVTQKARKHFGCSSLAGMELENQGGFGSRGSHWERRLVYNELMTPSTIEEPVMSEITLALLEDSGWYDVDYSVAEPLNFGRGRGCPFVNSHCLNNKQPASPEWCGKVAAEGCSYTGYKKAQCAVKGRANGLPSAFNYFGDGTVAYDDFADNCPYMFGYTNGDCRVQGDRTSLYDETFGSQSKCFTGDYVKIAKGNQYRANDVHSGCHKYACAKLQSGNFQLTVTIGTASVVCKKPGEKKTITGYMGNLVCPDPNIYCASFGKTFDPRVVPGSRRSHSEVTEQLFPDEETTFENEV